MKRVISVILVIEVLAYLWLCWIAFVREQSHVPLAYIGLHIVAALHLLCVLALLATYRFQSGFIRHRILAIALGLPAILWVAVLFTIKMVQRGL